MFENIEVYPDKHLDEKWRLLLPHVIYMGGSLHFAHDDECVISSSMICMGITSIYHAMCDHRYNAHTRDECDNLLNIFEIDQVLFENKHTVEIKVWETRDVLSKKEYMIRKLQGEEHIIISSDSDANLNIAINIMKDIAESDISFLDPFDLTWAMWEYRKHV